MERALRQRQGSVTGAKDPAEDIGAFVDKLFADARARGVRDGDLVALTSRTGEISLHAKVTERVQPGVVYTTFHHPSTAANVVTTEFTDWATDCPEYKVTAVQVSPSNGPSAWQDAYEAETLASRRVATPASLGEPAE